MVSDDRCNLPLRPISAQLPRYCLPFSDSRLGAIIRKFILTNSNTRVMLLHEFEPLPTRSTSIPPQPTCRIRFNLRRSSGVYSFRINICAT
jgi:hypothetical protein